MQLSIKEGPNFFTGLNSIESDSKKSIERLSKFLDLTNKYEIAFSNNNATQLSKHWLEDVATCFRKHLLDSFGSSSEIVSNFINHCLGHKDMAPCTL